MHWQDPAKGLTYYRRAQKLVDTARQASTHSVILNNIGMAFQEMEEMDSARYYLNRALRKSRLLDDSVKIAHRLNNLALLAMKQNRFESARKFLEESVSIYRKRKLHHWLARGYANLGKLYTGQNLFDAAGQYYRDALEIAEVHQDHDNLVIIYGGLSNYYQKRGDFRQALLYQRSLAAMKDSIFQTDKRKQLQEFDLKYETSEKEAQIHQLAIENELQNERLAKARSSRISLLALLTSMALIGLLAFSYYRFRQKVKLTEREKTIALQMQEIDHLRQRIATELNNQRNKTSLLTLEELNQLTESPLTNREYEILQAISQGLSNQQISDQQHVSINTVKYHLKNIYDKLAVKNRVQAAKVLSK